MNTPLPSFMSYCWNIGSTSFRTKDFNRSIEIQLQLLNELWAMPGNAGERWKANEALHARYYALMKERGFVTGEASNPSKDAREKTSGLADIGLIDDERRLTEAGRALLAITASGDFAPDNMLHLDRDSYLYLRQLLKVSCAVASTPVRPLPLVIRAISAPGLDGYVTVDELTYLLPLAITEELYEKVVGAIPAIRAGEMSVDDFILEVLMAMPNYQAARRMMMTCPMSRELMVAVGMNRKSRDKARYDEAYYDVYVALARLVLAHDSAAMEPLAAALGKLKLATAWRAYLFGRSSRAALRADPVGCLRPSALTRACDEREFRAAFFDAMHLLKAKSTLKDYMDLNRRYLSLADVLIFADGKISLDVLPGRFFALTGDALAAISYSASAELGADTPLGGIAPGMAVSEERLLAELSRYLGRDIEGLDVALDEVERERYGRLHRLLDERFTPQELASILESIDCRRDNDVRRKVTDNADVPTIFEYVVGLSWYRLSGCRGKVLDYMRLSLDANLLPKTHASGGGADIVYEYQATAHYPTHRLLIEGTLTDKVNQRRMEMEPVSRHLGDELLASGNGDSYCVFVAPHLDPNVISDFRSRRDHVYYDRADATRHITGMKIIPMSTADLRAALLGGVTYAALYARFATAHTATRPALPLDWYKECVSLS